jgi:hypothetical protein
VGVPGIQRAALIVLALASTYTVFQRILMVRGQALARDTAPQDTAPQDTAPSSTAPGDAGVA